MKQIFEFLLMIVLMQAHRLFFESALPLMVRACNGDVSFYFQKKFFTVHLDILCSKGAIL